MRKYLQIKQISAQQVASEASISLVDFEKFLQGLDAIDSSQMEQLNRFWPEMIAYGFDIDISLCTENQRIPLHAS
ncbi:hypothetical protein [Thiomicrorhabdus xiamenensis]|uniref:HTH cro/C1-type domain-containing protein n=1 Tax=Thiomicrorhabdus xiamenensis TaxID=2739063 RepID=A0A7D4NNQ1_9GAMM|nr:hypothetical protein [Thiomicrorhabdus xiamenensis]QKI88933.1 hypothetical protein HQN79_04790 [Thiomicrorhabdus xiamenensis]